MTARISNVMLNIPSFLKKKKLLARINDFSEKEPKISFGESDLRTVPLNTEVFLHRS